MTLDEVNSKIEELEKQIKELKEVKKQLKRPPVNVDQKKKEWLDRTEEIVQHENKIMSCRDFCKKHERVYDDGSNRFMNSEFYLSEMLLLVYRYGFKNLRQGYIARLVWNDRIHKIIRQITKRRTASLNDRKGNCNLSEEELEEFRKRLDEFIDDWCRQWAL